MWVRVGSFLVKPEQAAALRTTYNEQAVRFVALLFAVSMGCAGADGWQRLNKIPRQDVFPSPAAAAASARPVPLKVGQLEYLELASTDRAVMIDDDRSYFKVVAVSLGAGASVQVRVASLCDCVGVRKWIFVPLIYVFDGAGQPVTTPDPQVEAKDNDLSNPMRLVVTWTFTARSPGSYRVLVAADTSYVGAQVGTASASPWSMGLLHKLVEFDVKAVAVGQFTFLTTQ